MIPDNTANTIDLYLKNVKSVRRTFIFSRKNAAASKNSLEKNLGYFTLISSGKVPKRVFIETIRGKIVICITENFLFGAVLQKNANLPLVDILLTKMASNLEKCVETFKTNIHAVEDKIKERIDALTGNAIRTSVISLMSQGFNVEGEITVTVNPHTEKEPLKKKVQAILNEEIPFFCDQCITIEVKQKFSGILNVPGLKRQHLVKVIQKIQAI